MSDINFATMQMNAYLFDVYAENFANKLFKIV